MINRGKRFALNLKENELECRFLTSIEKDFLDGHLNHDASYHHPFLNPRLLGPKSLHDFNEYKSTRTSQLRGEMLMIGNISFFPCRTLDPAIS